MAFKCPVPGCEQSEKEFLTEAALKSHIRNVHPDYQGEGAPARQVPIVEEDFATLLKKFRIKADLATNIAENVSQTGGPRVFEDPDTLLKRLTLWSHDIHPAERKNIIDQWFAERGIDIPPEIKAKAGMTTEQIQEAEKKTKDEGGVRYVYDTKDKAVRMAKDGEKGGTLDEAKELRQMAEEDENKGTESPFMQDGEGRWVLNPKARVTGVELMAVQSMQRSQEKGEPVDPITAITQAAATWKTLREGLGGGASTLPPWMTDPVAFTNAIKTITGGIGGDSALKETLAEMKKTMETMKEDKWQAQFASQQKQILEITNLVSKAIDTITDLQKGKVGRTEMDIIHEIATDGLGFLKTELPGVRKDIKEALGSAALPPGKSPEQREDRKKKYQEAIDADREIEEIGKRLFLNKS